MGIDLLEDNELSSLAPCRSHFADEDKYSNFLGIGNKKKTSTVYKEQAMKDLPVLNSKMSCDQINSAIEQAQAVMDARRGAITAGAKSKLQTESLTALEGYISDAKRIASTLQCEIIKDQEEQKKSQEETLNVLQNIGSGTATSGISGTNKYILYGIGGVLVLGAIIILLKPSK